MSDIGDAVREHLKGMKDAALDHCAGLLDKEELIGLKKKLDEASAYMEDAVDTLVNEKGISGSGAAMDALLAGRITDAARRDFNSRFPNASKVLVR